MVRVPADWSDDGPMHLPGNAVHKSEIALFNFPGSKLAD
jgi:hypothetical protein